MFGDFCGCGTGPGSMRDQLNFSVKETEKGVQIDVTPKDAAKTDSLKSFVKGFKDFCNCC
ncbi:MAG: hypothetical protein A2Y33_06625 [Spirochaetes bacterium GWF1_51_8]|nr:MAG: hypothetical protein A2Y33_06625 [Spirochaetes bacterium GWF1_51_8]